MSPLQALRQMERDLHARPGRRGRNMHFATRWLGTLSPSCDRGVPRNSFWSMWSPKEFFSSFSAVWVALLVLPSCMHRQGCCLAGDSHAWTKSTQRTRMALCHTGTPGKRQRDSLGVCEMGIDWVRFVSPELVQLFVCLNQFCFKHKKREK